VKATKRAKRIAKRLEELNWTVFSGERTCKSCGRHEYSSGAVFCSMCAAALPDKLDSSQKILAELEDAISYALGEQK
jgi:hypothetical protein